MIADIFTAWSAAFTVWFSGAIILAVVRLFDMWREMDWSRRCLAVGASFICAGIAWHQGVSTIAWMHDAYTAAQVQASTWGYRGCWTVGVILFGGASSYDRCGHHGWMGLVLIGLLAGATAVALS